MAEVLAYVAAAVIAAWGVSDALPTRHVVAGFDPTAVDNHRVILQEWIIEAVAMAFAVVTAFTGARTSVIWFKICPALLSSTAALLVVASVV
jgi:hypothetical protein